LAICPTPGDGLLEFLLDDYFELKLTILIILAILRMHCCFWLRLYPIHQMEAPVSKIALHASAAFAVLYLTFGMANAAVFVCTNDTCSTWRAATPNDEVIATTGAPNCPTTGVTVKATLSNSDQDSITNGYNNIARTDLYIDRRFWHKGGDFPIDDRQCHLTVKVYKNNGYVKTCHTYDSNPTGKYQALCN
jgi:hypothetical protein